MRTKKPILKALLIMALAFVVVTGCENGGDSPSHDFGDNDPNVILAMGDSITRGYGLPDADSYPAQLSALTGKRVVNAGVDGARSEVGVSQVSGLLASRNPGYLLILYGVNDLIHTVDILTTVDNLRTIIQAAKANSTIPILGSLTPVYESHEYLAASIADLNSQIKAMAREEGVSVADLYGALDGDSNLIQPDGLHPTSAGAGLIASKFQPYVY